jgi:hypothetical protein
MRRPTTRQPVTASRPATSASPATFAALWSYGDVSRHADAIFDRLQTGVMPCDGAWPLSNIDLFQRWVGAGKRS